MTLLYDPPSGWQFGFPKPYLALDNETLVESLIRDGYPEEWAENFGAKYCRFIGSREELESLDG